MSEGTELGPCLRCGEHAGELLVMRSVFRYYVQCGQCGWFTKPALSETDALESWGEKPPMAE